MSDKTIKALLIVKGNPCIRATQFAQKMWPDSNMHRKVSNQGHGACKGKAAWLCAGSYLSRLRDMGLITHDIVNESPYRVTDKGLELIKSKNKK